jgi:ketosteroid isomerase-like protein
MGRHPTFATLASLLLVACSSETVTQPPPPPVNWQSLRVLPAVDASADIVSAKERALPALYMAALESPGFAQLGPLLEDEAHFDAAGMDETHGKASVIRAHDILLGAFDDRKVSPTRVWRTPGEQTVEWTMTATQGREWMGVALTKKSVSFRGLTLLWTKDDGSVTDVHVYFDVAVVKAQLGAGPKDLLALAPVPAATAAPEVVEQTGSPQETENVNTVKAALDALENNKEAVYLASLADDVEVQTLEHATPAKGKADARAYFRAMRKAVGQLDTTVVNAWGVGKYAIVEYTIAGEQLGPIGWMPMQRDRVIRLEIVDVCELSGGRITRTWRYDNPAQITGSTQP